MKHDVVVIGGGHAGCEAAHAAARMGARVALVTLEAEAIGRLSCNPAVGGIGKGHLVREVDALDGLMGKVADAAGIQFRLLNRSRGPAVRGPRAQVDRTVYRAAMQGAIAEAKTITVLEGEAADIVLKNGAVAGIVLADGRQVRTGAVVLTTGTFLGGVIHLGDERWAAGRMGEAAASRLADRLRALELPLGRLKTGTPPRLAAASIRWDALEAQPGDVAPAYFSDTTLAPALPQRPCHITRTTPATHALIRDALHRSALYAGHISGVGPRYCPSIEDKVVRFAGRDSHQVFLEPEGLESPLIYPNGISNSLPREVQLALVRTMPGCAAAQIVQPGYAIEYTFVDPRALSASLELRALPRLFLAGQINGTTGYEEAAAQGLLAGVNAARRAGDAQVVTLARETGYLGVMVDDLVGNGVDEPYRMFTSRAEHRLSLRADNAGDRLTRWGAELGVVGGERAARQVEREADLARARALLGAIALSPKEAASHGIALNEDGRRRNGFDLLVQEGCGWALLTRLDRALAKLSEPIRQTLEAEALYGRYTERHRKEAHASDRVPIPEELLAGTIAGLSNELQQKLKARRPATIGEARRISGMTPAGLALIAAHARRAAA